jgi:hypothetical protein
MNANKKTNSNPHKITCKYKILEVPLFAQATRMWCWAASLEMIRHYYYGDEVPQGVQADNRFKRNDCCSRPTPWSCIKGGRPEYEKYGFNPPESQYGALPWQELVRQIHAGKPVGFSWEWRTCEGSRFYGSHYMVARGYIIFKDTRLVVVNDPLPANPDKHKGGTVSIMTYDDYVRFCPGYIHAYTHYDITTANYKWFLKSFKMVMALFFLLLSGLSDRFLEIVNKQKFLRGVQGGSFFKKRPSGRRGQGISLAALESLELLKALPRPLLKELGLESRRMVKKVSLGEPFSTSFFGAGRLQAAGEIPGDVVEVHYPVEVDEKPVTSITLRKRKGEWTFAVFGDRRALTAAAALKEIPPCRGEPPAYFMVQIQSMNLTFMAYFSEEEDNKLYFIPTHEDPDLAFPLYEPVPAAEVFWELKYILEQAAEGEGGAALKEELKGPWKEMDEALDDQESGDKEQAFRGMKKAVEILGSVFGQLESQK